MTQCFFRKLYLVYTRPKQSLKTHIVIKDSDIMNSSEFWSYTLNILIVGTPFILLFILILCCFLVLKERREEIVNKQGLEIETGLNINNHHQSEEIELDDGRRKSVKKETPKPKRVQELKQTAIVENQLLSHNNKQDFQRNYSKSSKNSNYVGNQSSLTQETEIL